jgi:hypothetical protein
MTQKQRFILLSCAVVGGFVLLAAVVFYPVTKTLLSTRSEILRLENELAARNFSGGEIPLKSQETQEKHLEEQFREHWQRARLRLAKFSQYHDQIQNADRVDYLAHLATQRGRLYQRALAFRLQIPPDLGMPDAVTTDNDPAVLMMQLRVISAIVEIAERAAVPGQITAIEPLPPVTHNLQNTATPYFKEFPVRVELETELEPLIRLIYGASTHDELLAIRNLRVEKRIPKGNEPLNESNPRLRASVVFDAIVMLKDPAEIKPVAPPARAAPRNLEPMGY